MSYLKTHQKVVVVLSLLFIALIVSGCSGTPVPYGQVFIGKRLGNDSFYSCSEENSGFRVGIEVPVTKRLSWAPEYEHISHLLCGNPFNDKPEDNADHIGITVTYRLVR